MTEPGNRLFVYGTLQPGGAWWHVVEPWVVGAVEASCQGRLWDTGNGYPAATFEEEHVVHGAVLELLGGRVQDALAELDEFENEYDRTTVETSVGTAWTYRWRGTTMHLQPIESGRFRHRNGGR